MIFFRFEDTDCDIVAKRILSLSLVPMTCDMCGFSPCPILVMLNDVCSRLSTDCHHGGVGHRGAYSGQGSSETKTEALQVEVARFNSRETPFSEDKSECLDRHRVGLTDSTYSQKVVTENNAKESVSSGYIQ